MARCRKPNRPRQCRPPSGRASPTIPLRSAKSGLLMLRARQDKIMHRRDRVAIVAALVLIASIGAFVVSQSDDASMGAYYYFAPLPTPTSH